MADTYDSSLPDDSVSSHSPRRPSSQRVPGTPRSAVPLPMLAAPPSPLARKNNLVLVLGFALLIAAGTVVLRLPLAATGEPLTWSEAFFTATSATTVTGLTVVSTAEDLSRFGQLVVLLLIELGGVGFITFSVLLFSLIGRRIGLGERQLLQQSLGVLETVRIGRLAVAVLAITLALQLIGAALLWLRWAPVMGVWPAAYQAMFHSVSAFCNAGFDLYSGTETILFGFGRDPWTLTVLMALIVIGGLGVLVISDIVTFPRDRRLSVHTRLTLLISAVLTTAGFLLILADDLFSGNALHGLNVPDRALMALFNAVSARTAGMSVIDVGHLSQANAVVVMALMFIGGAPASMAGGVTISTVGVLFVTVLSTVRGQPQGVIFGRVFPLETIAKAVAIMSVSTLVCFSVILLVLAVRPAGLLPVAFEVISAFSNTGYSLGETTRLPDWGRMLIAGTMFWGRLGPLTLVILLAQVEHPSLARYPTERIVIG